MRIDPGKIIAALIGCPIGAIVVIAAEWFSGYLMKGGQ